MTFFFFFARSQLLKLNTIHSQKLSLMQRKGERILTMPFGREVCRKMKYCCQFYFLTVLLLDSSIHFFDRSDHKEMMEEPGDSQQSGYSQCTVCCAVPDVPRFGTGWLSWARADLGFWVRLGADSPLCCAGRSMPLHAEV